MASIGKVSFLLGSLASTCAPVSQSQLLRSRLVDENTSIFVELSQVSDADQKIVFYGIEKSNSEGILLDRNVDALFSRVVIAPLNKACVECISDLRVFDEETAEECPSHSLKLFMTSSPEEILPLFDHLLFEHQTGLVSAFKNAYLFYADKTDEKVVKHMTDCCIYSDVPEIQVLAVDLLGAFPKLRGKDYNNIEFDNPIIQRKWKRVLAEI
jgi:hypothetical protein